MEEDMKQQYNAQSKQPSNKHQTLVRRGQRIKMAADLAMARSSGSSRQWSRALCRRIVRDNSSKSHNQCKRTRKEAVNDCDLVSGSDDGVERRIKDLQRLVPGGEEMEVDDLFEETADYIEALKGQVSLMITLTEVLDGESRERRTMGG